MNRQGKSFCEECLATTPYQVVTEQVIKNVRGSEIVYNQFIASCSECHAEVWVEEIEDANFAAKQEAVRMAESGITVPEIKEILEKYNIAQKSLSNLLGWGDVTITRYLGGLTPQKKYSDELRRLRNDPYYMHEILMANKDEISGIGFKKCRTALDEILKFSAISQNKIDQIANYIINSNQTDPLTLQKLLYYVQGHFFMFRNEPAFNEECMAWPHGPVYKGIYDKYKKFKYNTIEEAPYELSLTSEEKEIIDNVLKYYGCYSGRSLEYMTHEENPWKETRKGLGSSEQSRKIIEKNLIKDYFTKIKLDFKIEKLEDVKNYSRYIFEQAQEGN